MHECGFGIIQRFNSFDVQIDRVDWLRSRLGETACKITAMNIDSQNGLLHHRQDIDALDVGF